MIIVYLKMLNYGKFIFHGHLGALPCLRLQYSTSKQKIEKQPKLASDILKYLENDSEYKNLICKLPKSLIKKYKSPESMYLINKKTANNIVNTIRNHLDEKSPIIEVNPGLGFLSEEILKNGHNHLYLYETSNHFSEYIKVGIFVYILENIIS